MIDCFDVFNVIRSLSWHMIQLWQRLKGHPDESTGCCLVVNNWGLSPHFSQQEKTIHPPNHSISICLYDLSARHYQHLVDHPPGRCNGRLSLQTIARWARKPGSEGSGRGCENVGRFTHKHCGWALEKIWHHGISSACLFFFRSTSMEVMVHELKFKAHMLVFVGHVEHPMLRGEFICQRGQLLVCVDHSWGLELE